MHKYVNGKSTFYSFLWVFFTVCGCILFPTSIIIYSTLIKVIKGLKLVEIFLKFIEKAIYRVSCLSRDIKISQEIRVVREKVGRRNFLFSREKATSQKFIPHHGNGWGGGGFEIK